MIITKNYLTEQTELGTLTVGDFFEYKGELYMIVNVDSTYYTCFNFSQGENFRLYFQIDVFLIDKSKIEICYSL